MAVYNWYCGPDKTGKTCKVLIFLHPHTHHKRSSASNLWCPIPGWQQWWQGQLQSHNLLSSTYGRRAESWKASSSTSNCCCYCCCCCCCWGSRWRGDNHQHCYRASDKLQQVAVAPMNHSKTTFYFQNASWREGDRKLILRHSCCCRRRRWFWAGTNSGLPLNMLSSTRFWKFIKGLTAMISLCVIDSLLHIT